MFSLAEHEPLASLSRSEQIIEWRQLAIKTVLDPVGYNARVGVFEELEFEIKFVYVREAIFDMPKLL